MSEKPVFFRPAVLTRSVPCAAGCPCSSAQTWRPHTFLPHAS